MRLIMRLGCYALRFVCLAFLDWVLVRHYV